MPAIGEVVESKSPGIAGRPNAIPEIIFMAERDAYRVREVIAEHYGFVVTLQYAADLIAFVEVYVEGK